MQCLHSSFSVCGIAVENRQGFTGLFYLKLFLLSKTVVGFFFCLKLLYFCFQARTTIHFSTVHYIPMAGLGL